MSIFAATTLAPPARHATAIRLPGLPAEVARGVRPLSGLTTQSPLMILDADGAIHNSISIPSPPMSTPDVPRRAAFSGRFCLWALGVTAVEALIGLSVKLMLG
jgi:hypothetical protein